MSGWQACAEPSAFAAALYAVAAAAVLLLNAVNKDRWRQHCSSHRAETHRPLKGKRLARRHQIA